MNLSLATDRRQATSAHCWTTSLKMSQKIRSRPPDGSQVSDQIRPPLYEFVSIVMLPCEAPPFVFVVGMSIESQCGGNICFRRRETGHNDRVVWHFDAAL
jgi:hypothetical protein